MNYHLGDPQSSLEYLNGRICPTGDIKDEAALVLASSGKVLPRMGEGNEPHLITMGAYDTACVLGHRGPIVHDGVLRWCLA